MTFHIPTPRLLPVTICMLVVVLGARSTLLLHSLVIAAQTAAFISPALASGTEAAGQTEKPGSKDPPPVRPDHTAEKKPPPEPPKAEDKPDGPPAMTDGERSVLMDLRARRQELEAREATLSARESMLTAAEGKLSSRVEELQGLQKKLEALDASHRQQEDVAWQGLVKVYETMKPRDAATIFNDLGMQVLLAVVDRMKEAKAAAILAAMSPDRAREVTMQLALSRSRASNAADAGDKPGGPGKPPGSGT
jgi:flagellar motility protein MotE (MotC chaperone)